MNKQLASLLVVFAVLFFRALSAEIITVNDINELRNYASPDTLILVDIDDTLLRPSTQLGSSHWWAHMQNTVGKDIDIRNAFPGFNPLIGWIFHHLTMEPMQSDTAQVIRDLQNQNICVLALTARPKNATFCPHYDRVTREDLRSIGVDFTQSKLQGEIDFAERDGLWSFSYGVIFSNRQLKGGALKDFLHTFRVKPERIVLVDDKRYQIASVEHAMADVGIPFVGLHYQTSKQQAELDAAIANIQWHALMTNGKIPSDEEARQLQALSPTRDQDFFLNHMIQNVSISTGM
jgi:hypothetical protein